ncbi:MAG TPA: ornithine cyclodeaminase family protein [Puia sp.]|nr:ornithine cyclodeaminase family protein [Puia sp.]
MDPIYINKDKVASLLPMGECISQMAQMFQAKARGEILQPLRSVLWLPDKKGLLGLMPAYAGNPAILGIKVISVFPGNMGTATPTHQGVVILFDAENGQPLLMLDGAEITAIRTAAASAAATSILSRENAEVLAIIGSGEQAARHVESILLVRKIKQVNCWSRNGDHASTFAKETAERHRIEVNRFDDPREAVQDADIICTVTASREPVVAGEWLPRGVHINAVGACTPAARELDTAAIAGSKLFTDSYDSIFHEAGDFLIPKKEGAVTNDHVKAEIGEVICGTKKGRENADDITVFKSLGIAAEDLFSAWHVWKKVAGDGGF